MKKDIHPKYYNDVTMKCACGASFKAGSTLPEINMELCSNCHPFYTGKQKLVDTAGRVDKFKARTAKQAEVAAVRKGKKSKKAKAKAKKQGDDDKSSSTKASTSKKQDKK